MQMEITAHSPYSKGKLGQLRSSKMGNLRESPVHSRVPPMEGWVTRNHGPGVGGGGACVCVLLLLRARGPFLIGGKILKVPWVRL